MSDLREAAQQALEALELAQTDVHWELNSPTRKFLRKAEKNLRAALAEPVQEPVAVHQFREQHCVNWYDGHPDHSDGGGPYEERTLYTALPQRKPLTDEEIHDCFQQRHRDRVVGRRMIARAIERAHGIEEEE